MSEVKISEPLNLRQAETIARWLKQTRQSKVSAAMCRWQTPEQIAEMVLGKGNRGIAALADEIRERLGQGG